MRIKVQLGECHLPNVRGMDPDEFAASFGATIARQTMEGCRDGEQRVLVTFEPGLLGMSYRLRTFLV